MGVASNEYAQIRGRLRQLPIAPQPERVRHDRKLSIGVLIPFLHQGQSRPAVEVAEWAVVPRRTLERHHSPDGLLVEGGSKKVALLSLQRSAFRNVTRDLVDHPLIDGVEVQDFPLVLDVQGDDNHGNAHRDNG